jgi:WD40 repeat protein
MNESARTIPARFAPIAQSRALRLARVLGGDALAHPYGRALATRWSVDGARFFVLAAPSDSEEELGAIVEFDARDGRLVRSIDDVSLDNLAFAIAHDGARALLLSSSGATMVSLADRREQRLPSATEPYEYTRSARFSPDATWALYATHRDALYLARRGASNEWSAERVPNARASFAITSDGAFFAYATTDGHIALARASDAAIVQRFVADGDPVVALGFSATGALLVAAHRDGTLRCLERSTLAPRWTLRQKRAVRAIGVDEGASRVWVSVESSRELVLDLSNGSLLDDRRLKVDPDVRAPDVYSPDGRRALSVWYKELALHDCRTGTQADLHDGHSGAITGIAAAPDGSQFATTSADGTVRTWRASDGALLWVFGELEGRRSIVAARYRDDVGQLLTRGSYNDVRLWDPVAGVELDPGAHPYSKALQAAYQYPHTFSTSWVAPIVGTSHYVLSGPASSADYSSANASWRILRYDPDTGDVLWKHSDNTSRDSRFALSPDGRVLVQRQNSGALRLFAMDDGSLRSAPACELRGVEAIAFAASGALVLCASDGLWCCEDVGAAPVRRASLLLQGPLAIAPAGDVMACRDLDGRVLVVSLADGAVLDELDLALAQDRCTALAWVDEGRSLAVGTARHLALLYARAE